MLQCQFGGMVMVQNDIGNALVVHVAGDRYSGDGQRLGEVEVQRDEPFCSALQKQAAIFVEEFLIMAVHTGYEEIILEAGAVLDSGDDRGTVAISDLMGNNPDGKVLCLRKERAKKLGR